jgi:hypothetical protein
LAEFEAAMASACESVLREILGQSGFASTVYHLSRNGISLLDCALRPAEFDDALSVVFNPASATMIEGKIMRSFYRAQNGLEFRWGEGLNFCEEVRKARKAFETAHRVKGLRSRRGGKD